MKLFTQEELYEIGEEQYIKESDSRIDNFNSYKSELSIIKGYHALKEIVPKEVILLDRLESKAVLKAVAAMLDENNRRLEQLLSRSFEEDM